ncbi:MAG: hypothetical protein RIT35_301 [Pseudomonadota bacterium]|jgi:predicted secreted protein
MSIVTFIVTFILIWWIMLFIILPIGLDKHPQDVPAGHDRGAPISPSLGKKMLLTTLIACTLTGIVEIMIRLGIIVI